jgi:hypothetical protein
MKSLTHKIMVIVPCLALLFWGFSPVGHAFLKGDINGDGKIGLSEAINALQASSGMRTATAVKTANVPGDFNTIQEAIDAAAPGDTVNIGAGTYNENLTISKSNIILQGAAGTIINAENTAQAVITVDGARQVTLKRFTVQSGLVGIAATAGAAVIITDVTAQDNANSGIGILIYKNSTSVLTNCTATRNGTGFEVGLSSSATFRGAIVATSNQSAGIAVNATSSIVFDSGSTITANNNGGRGIDIGKVSSLECRSGSIQANNNGDRGIHVGSISAADFGGGSAVVTNGNSSWGIQVSDSSVISLSNGTISSSQNQEDGIGIFNSGKLHVFSNGTVTVENNARHGVNLYSEGYILTFDTGKLIVKNNPNAGLCLINGSSIRMENGGSVVTDNGVNDITMNFGSRSLLKGNTIGKMLCDATALSTGDKLCPP